MPPIEPFDGECHTCGLTGHKAKDCGPRAYRFKCNNCRNQFTSICKSMKGTAPCYRCGCHRVRPEYPVPKSGTRQSNSKHNCSSCKGQGQCPAVAAAMRRTLSALTKTKKKKNK